MRLLSGRAELALLPALSDLKGQWERLFPDGFVAEAGVAALRHYPRYLQRWPCGSTSCAPTRAVTPC